MKMRRRLSGLALAGLMATTATAALAEGYSPAQIDALKAQAVAGIEARAKLAQVMNDTIFSFGELAFQETETSAYITSILEKNGFKVERGIAGLPTGWKATWTNGTGGPVIAFGSDIDCIPKASQKPGVPWHDPIVAGAPGHGEGHNSGQALNVVAALALKDIMVREHINGTLVLWPGVAEELVAGKAYMVRDGVFNGIDATIFTHVDSTLGTSWGQPKGTGLVSVKYNFHGEAAHAAGAPAGPAGDILGEGFAGGVPFDGVEVAVGVLVELAEDLLLCLHPGAAHGTSAGSARSAGRRVLGEER